MFTLIVAINQLNYISKERKMLWHIEDDLCFFYKTINKSNIICGINTWRNMKKEYLKDVRVFILSSKNHHDLTGNIIIAHSINEVVSSIKNDRNSFICGGLEIYDTFIKNKLVSEYIITTIHNNDIGDKRFDINIYKDILHCDNSLTLTTHYGTIEYGRVLYR